MSEDAFARRVLAMARRIPAGRVTTYGGLAALAGRPRAARAVGHVMRTCNDPLVPCHRVIGAGGRLGGYGGQEGLKRALLEAEGLVVRGGRLRGWPEIAWPDPTRARPGGNVSGGRDRSSG